MTDPLLLLGVLVTLVTLGGYVIALQRRIRSAQERKAAVAEHIRKAVADEAPPT